MLGSLKLVIFDVDGTLVDSQNHILAAMSAAFCGEGLPVPGRAQVLAVVGLSLPEAIARLAPGVPAPGLARLVAAYKDAYADVRAQDGAASSPLFPGIREILDDLLARDALLVAIATGKSRRGLDHVLDMHGLTGRFVSEQVADHHPSKPHPAMLAAVLSETGAAPRDAVMVGDTSFDIEMGAAAGVRTLAVTWGYHPAEVLARARPDRTIDRVGELPAAVAELLELEDG